MSIYISMLRGINVGGKTIKMDALRKMCEELGFKDVLTYIQSGNIIYRYKTTTSQKLSDILRKNVALNFGFDVPVLTLSLPELAEVVKVNPYLKQKDKDPAFLHVTFLAEKPDPDKVKAIENLDFNGDEFTCVQQAIYLYCPGGYGKTKLNNSFFENKLKVSATTRNWKTTKELLSMGTAAL